MKLKRRTFNESTKLNKSGLIVVAFTVLLIIALLLMTMSGGVGEKYLKKTNKIITAHEGEDYYQGLESSDSIEARLDYMILKYTGSLEKLEDESDNSEDGNAAVDDDNYDKAVVGDDGNELQQTIEDAVVNNEPGVKVVVSNDISWDEIFEMCEDARYSTAEGGILLKSVSSSWHSTGGNQTEYSITFNYSRSLGEIESIKTRTARTADTTYNSLKLEKLSDYNKVDIINTYICDLTEYPNKTPYSDLSHTAFGAFIEKSSVCDGYARAAKMLCDRAGVECIIVTGVCRNGEGHAWNMVKLDGKWYQWDVCWNDGMTESERKEYFLVTDKHMEYSRSWDKEEYPKSSETPYVK